MFQHTNNFLLIAPELYQLVTLNVLLLGAISLSYYKLKSPSIAMSNTATKLKTHFENTSTLIQDIQTKGIQTQNSNQKSPQNYSSNSNLIYQALNISPVLQVEVLIKVYVLNLICCALLYLNNPWSYSVGLANSVIIDNLSTFMSILLTLSASVTLIFSAGALKRSRYEFVFILMLSILGMLMLIKSYNFLTLYLSVELQSLSFYMLAAMKARNEASAEAGLKYFILSAFSSAVLLLGITLIYGACGSQNFADLSLTLNYLNSNPNMYLNHYYANLSVGLGCVIISLLFKLAAVPFHAWIADVYEGSPTPITAFFALTSKIGVLAVLIRLVQHSDYTLNTLLSAVAILSLIVGSLSAMRQVKLKRLLAFSGIANVGWFLLALITGQWDVLIIHLIVYLLLSTTLFSIFVLPLFRTHPNLEYRERIDAKHGLIDHGADSQALKYINDLNQIYRTNPSLAFFVTLAMFSLAGIPPLAGFYSKYLVLNALTQDEQYLILSLSLACAVVSAFYYIRIVKTMYFTNLNPSLPNEGPQFTIDTSSHEANANAYICTISSLATLAFLIRPDYVCIWAFALQS